MTDINMERRNILVRLAAGERIRRPQDGLPSHCLFSLMRDGLVAENADEGFILTASGMTHVRRLGSDALQEAAEAGDAVDDAMRWLTGEGYEPKRPDVEALWRSYLRGRAAWQTLARLWVESR